MSDRDGDVPIEEVVELEGLSLDDVGRWAIRKNDIVEYYAQVYAEILGTAKLKPCYIDGFANRGISRLRGSAEIVAGSALRVLAIKPQFDRYFFVELDKGRANDLARLVGERDDVFIEIGDANTILPARIFPQIDYGRYERALCFLDPYNMRGLRWETVLAAARTQAIDVIVHFPVMDANRSVLWNNASRVGADMAQKMTAFWGDESWRAAAYTNEGFLLPDLQRRQEIDAVIEAYRERLRAIAGFKVVSLAIPMKNSINATIYYLILASHNSAAGRITGALEKKFGTK